jgi:hypothetical protein
MKHPWIALDDRYLSDLIKLLQNHEVLLKKNKANLSAQEAKIVNIKDYKSKEDKEKLDAFYHLSDRPFPDSDENDSNPDENA